jgi:hypothetical protein
MTILCSIPCSYCNNQDLLGDVGKESDGGTATPKITPMQLSDETCITTANGDRKKPTANQMIL